MTKNRFNITVRGQEADDWEDCAAILTDACVVYHTLQIPYQSRDVVRERFENPPERWHGLVAVVEERVVGHLGLRLNAGRQAHCAHLGMMVHPDFQRHGVGTALLAAAIDLAENWLNVSRLDLEVFTDNATALRLYERFGFKIEGTLRSYAYREGEFVDVYLMARIRRKI